MSMFEDGYDAGWIKGFEAGAVVGLIIAVTLAGMIYAAFGG